MKDYLNEWIKSADGMWRDIQGNFATGHTETEGIVSISLISSQ